MLFNTLSVFSSFSLSAYLKLPVHRHSGWNIPKTAIKLEVSAVRLPHLLDLTCLWG